MFIFLNRYISTYINVQERDPKAHRFLGLLYEVEENIDKAVECYKVNYIRLKFRLCTAKYMMARVLII